jgi:hypothetical protein
LLLKWKGYSPSTSDWVSGINPEEPKRKLIHRGNSPRCNNKRHPDYWCGGDITIRIKHTFGNVVGIDRLQERLRSTLRQPTFVRYSSWMLLKSILDLNTSKSGIRSDQLASPKRNSFGRTTRIYCTYQSRLRPRTSVIRNEFEAHRI